MIMIMEIGKNLEELADTTPKNLLMKEKLLIYHPWRNQIVMEKK